MGIARITSQRGQSSGNLIQVTAVVGILVAAGWFLVSAANPCAYSEVSDPWKLSPLGFFSAGVAVVDQPSTKGRTGVVLAHGHDLSPQPVSYYGLDASTLSPATYGDIPDVFSEDYAYHGGVSAAYLDKDGYQDLCVTAYADARQLTSGGGVKIYRGSATGFDPAPSWEDTGYGASNCAFGDFDGDGDLDLVVTAAFEVRHQATTVAPPSSTVVWSGGGASGGLATGPAGEIAGIPPFPNPLDGKARTYRNDGSGNFTLWQTLTKGVGAMDVEVADVNRDGWVDLLLAGPVTQVYAGHKPDGTAPFQAQPSWESSNSHSISVSVDAAYHPDWDDSLMVAASHGCKYPGEPGCSVQKNGYDVYRPGKKMGTNPTTLASQTVTSGKKMRVPSRRCGNSHREYAAALTLEDLNLDKYPDLLAGMWTTSRASYTLLGNSVSLFPGKVSTGSKKPITYSQSSRKVLPGGTLAAAEIRVADVFDEDHCPETMTESFAVNSGQDQAVFTLSRGPVSKIVSVKVNGVLATAGWLGGTSGSTWTAPETKEWVSISPAPGATAAAKVEIEYQFGGTVDVVASSASPGPEFGASLVWRSRAMCSKKSDK